VILRIFAMPDDKTLDLAPLYSRMSRMKNVMLIERLGFSDISWSQS